MNVVANFIILFLLELLLMDYITITEIRNARISVDGSK